MFYYPKAKTQSFEKEYKALEFDSKKEKKRSRILFTRNEDQQLKELVKEYGLSDWALIAANMKGKTVRQCRERWLNNLSSSVVKSKWTETEDNILKRKYMIYGPKWKKLEQFFPGRTSYNIRNRWNSLFKFRKHLLNNSEAENDHQRNNDGSYNDEKISTASSNKDFDNIIMDRNENNNETTKLDNKSKDETNKSIENNISNGDVDMFNDIFSGFLFSCDDNLFF